MTTIDTIRNRRSTKSFTTEPVAREQIESLLELAVLAPNHRLSQPWRFVVMGPDARRAYGETLGGRKAKKVADADAARTIVERAAAEAVATPVMIAVVQQLSDNAEILEEDYAAIWMGIQNMLLGATELGLGSHLRTGAVLGDVPVRGALGVAEGERIVGLVLLGTAAGETAPKPRASAVDRTTWVA